MKNPLENLSPLHNLELFLRVKADKALLEHYKGYVKEKKDRSENDKEETIRQYEIDKKKKKVPNKCFKDRSDELIEYLLEDYLTHKGISGGLNTLREKEENRIRKAIDTGIVPNQDNTDWLMKSRGLMVGLGGFLLKNHRNIYREYGNSTFRLLKARYGKGGDFGEIFEDLDIFHSQDIPRVPKWRGREGRKEVIKFFKHLLEVHKGLALEALVRYHIEKIKDDSWKYDRNIMKMYMELGKKCGNAIGDYSRKKVVSKEFASACRKEDELLEAAYGKIFEDGYDILHRNWVKYGDRDRGGNNRKQLALEEILHTFENHVDLGIDKLMNLHSREIKKYELELNRKGIRYKKDGLAPRISDLIAFHKILIENNEEAWKEDMNIVLRYRDFIRKINIDFFDNNYLSKQIDTLKNSSHTAIKEIYSELFDLDIIHYWDMTQKLNSKKERKKIAYEAVKHLKEKHQVWKDKEEFIKTNYMFFSGLGLESFIKYGFDNSVNQFKLEFARGYGKELSGLTYLDFEYNELVKEEKEIDKLIRKARSKIDRSKHHKISIKTALESVSLEANQKEWYLGNRIRRRMLKFKLGPDKYYELMYGLFSNFLGREFDGKKDIDSQSWKEAGLSKKYRLEAITFIESHKNPKEGVEKILTTSNSPDRSDKTYYVAMNLPIKGIGEVRKNRLVTLIKFNREKDIEREARILEYLADAGCNVPKSFFVNNKQGYLCMQFLDSVSQDQLLKEKDYDSKAGLRKAMKALRRLHDNGSENLKEIIRYDLKLERRGLEFYEKNFERAVGRAAELRSIKINQKEFNEAKREYVKSVVRPLAAARAYFSHGDFYPGHVMEDGKISVIDIERAGLAPRVYDFANYVSYGGKFNAEQAMKDYSGGDKEIEREIRENLNYGMVDRNLRLCGVTANCINEGKGDKSFYEELNKSYKKQLIAYSRKVGNQKLVQFFNTYI